MEYLKFILILLAACFSVSNGMLGFSLEPAITKPQQRITMRCQGTLTNTQMVSWYKKQGEDGHPEILGFNNLISNSLYVDKLETADPEVIGDETIYVISLISANHEDSGYYGCGMMGEAIDKITWKELTIITPIRELKMFIIRSNETANMEMAVELKHGQDVTVNQGDEFYVRCMAIASNPPADMEITFGDHNLEDEFKTEEREYLDDPIISPASTLKMVLNDVNMTSIEPFVVEPEMSRTELTCKASVPSYDAKLITVRPILKSFPKVTCQDELAKIYETEVVLECEIECDPEPEHLYWYWTTHSGDNVTLHMDQNYDSNIVAKHSVNEEGKEIVKLIFGRVHTANAQAYHLVVDNGIGATNGTAVLNIVTPGQDVVAITIHPTAVSPGQTVKLDCRVDSKSSTTIMWYKRLNPDSPADVIGFNDQIFTDAYAPSMSAELVLTNGDTKLFRITIPNAKPEDTGDYACASATTESDKIPYLRLDIVEPLTSFNLYVYQTGSANDVTPLQSGSQLTLDKNRKYTIKCEALGSNPAADVQIQLINDISEQFDENIVSHLSGKEKDGALRAVKYGVTKQMDNFVPTRVINRQKLTCKALLPTKTDQSIDVTVITQSNVPVTIESSAHNVEVGESISILCNAKTLKLDDQVTWYRKRLDGSHDVIGTGEDIKNPLFKDRVISNDPVQNEGVQFSITIKDVRTQDSGEWGCSGVDADSTGIKYTDITIHDRSGNDDNTGESVHGAAGSCVFSSLLFASTLAFTMKANFS